MAEKTSLVPGGDVIERRGPADPWTKARRDYLCSWLRDTADRLNLAGWQITVEYDLEEDAHAYAQTHLTDGRDVARITLDREFLQEREEVQRHALVHELLHCHHRDATYMIEHDLAPILGALAYETWWPGFRRQVELMVDRLTSVIAPTIPKLDWPD